MARTGRGGSSAGLVVAAAIVLVPLLGIAGASADCAPVLGTITPSATGLSVSWTEACGGPGRVELRWYNNGANYTLLGTQGPLTALQNGGAVASSTALMTGKEYAPLELCAVYGKAPATSTSCGIQFGAVPENPLGQPVPVITYSSATQTEIDYSWEAFSSYHDYNVTITGLPQQNTSAYSFPWRNLQPGTPYTIGVQGCISGGVAGRNCGPFASKMVMTAAATPVPETPPQDLHAVVGPSGVQVVWTESQAEQESAITEVSEHAGLVVKLQYSGTTVSFLDAAVSAGNTYSYTVCLVAQAGGAKGCATTTATLLAPPPSCRFSTACPFYQNQPPQFTIGCTTPADFYSWSGTPVSPTIPPPGMVLLAGNSAGTTGSTTGEAVFAAACRVGTRNECVSYSVDVSQGQWCHPQNGGTPVEPPVLGAKGCQQCREDGGTCVRSRGGYICTGALR